MIWATNTNEAVKRAASLAQRGGCMDLGERALRTCPSISLEASGEDMAAEDAEVELAGGGAADAKVRRS